MFPETVGNKAEKKEKRPECGNQCASLKNLYLFCYIDKVSWEI